LAPVVTVLRRGIFTKAGSITTDIAGRAGIIIITRIRIEFVGTTDYRIASIGRAWIAVIAICVGSVKSDATPSETLVSGRALVNIITTLLIELVSAPRIRVTTVIGADVVVVAVGPGCIDTRASTT